MRQGGRLHLYTQRREQKRRAAEAIARRARPPLPPLEHDADPGVSGLPPADHLERLDDVPPEFRGYFPHDDDPR